MIDCSLGSPVALDSVHDWYRPDSYWGSYHRRRLFIVDVMDHVVSL